MFEVMQENNPSVHSKTTDQLLESLESLEHEEAEVLTEAGTKRKPKKDVIIRRAAGRRAIMLAKANSDPMYVKYRDMFERLLEVKSAILKKYGNAALKQAKTNFNNK